MILALNYKKLSSLIHTTNTLNRELDQYCDDLNYKVQNKIHQVEGRMSPFLNSADSYVKSKITEIRDKENNIHEFTSKVEALLETANTVDLNVARIIQNNQRTFFQKNIGLKPSEFATAMYSFWTGMTHVPVFGYLLENQVDACSALTKEIRYWWESNGSKNSFKTSDDLIKKITLATKPFLVRGTTGGMLFSLMLMQNDWANTGFDFYNKKGEEDSQKNPKAAPSNINSKPLENEIKDHESVYYDKHGYSAQVNEHNILEIRDSKGRLLTYVEGPFDENKKIAIEMSTLKWNDGVTWNKNIDAFLDATSQNAGELAEAWMAKGMEIPVPDPADGGAMLAQTVAMTANSISFVRSITNSDTPADIGDIRVKIQILDRNSMSNGESNSYYIENYVRYYEDKREFKTYDSIDHGMNNELIRKDNRIMYHESKYDDADFIEFY